MDGLGHTPLPCPAEFNPLSQDALLSGVVIPARSAREPLSCLGLEGSSTNGNSSSPPPPGVRDSRARRRTAYDLRSTSRALVGDIHDSVACCGHVHEPFRPFGRPLGDPDVATLVLGEDGKAAFRGVTRCGSPWSCPVCAPRVASARAEVLRPQIIALVESGWTAWSMTMTVSHEAAHDLSQLWSVLGKAWGRLTSGKRWQAIRDLGEIQYVRGYDVTHSARHGWHPHVHMTLLLGPEHGGSGAVPRWMLARWISVLGAMGWKAVPGAQHVVRADDPEAAARYAVTPAAVYETVSMATKRARKGGVPSRTPFEILQAAASDGGRSTELWREYVAATKGRRQVTVSRGLHLREDAEDIDETVGLPIADIGTTAMLELDRRRLSAVLLDAVELAAPADVYEAAASVLRRLVARDWGLCRPLAWGDETAPEVRPQPPPWVTHDPRKGSPGIRGMAAIRAYEAWRASQH